MNVVEGATRTIVDDNEYLYRGIVIDDNVGISKQIIYDNNLQKHRLSSAAFGGYEISVDIASKTTPQESLNRRPKSRALACVLAKEPKDLGCQVVEDPIDNETEKNLAHALICIDKSTNPSQRKIMAKKLAKKCKWSIPPVGYDMYEPDMSIE